MTQQHARVWAAAATAAIAAIAVVVMMLCKLSFQAMLPDLNPRSEIELAQEFVEFEELPPVVAGQAKLDPATATIPEPSDAPSKPAPESGTDTRDAGPKGAPATPVHAKTEQPMKVDTRQKPKKQGPEVDKKKAEEEAIKRQANNQVQNAFAGAQGKHNTDHGRGDEANAGRPDGTAHQGSVRGRGTGSVGGGWRIPQYAPVPSSVTGSVKMTVKIDREGRVTSVTLTGGNPPAATNSAVCQACVAEVKSRRFTRPNADDAPETATAYITYRFK